MTELAETKSVQDLKEWTKREDKAAQQRAVDKLLSLGNHAQKQEPKYANALTREMMKSAGS